MCDLKKEYTWEHMQMATSISFVLGMITAIGMAWFFGALV